MFFFGGGGIIIRYLAAWEREKKIVHNIIRKRFNSMMVYFTRLTLGGSLQTATRPHSAMRQVVPEQYSDSVERTDTGVKSCSPIFCVSLYCSRTCAMDISNGKP